MVIRNERVPETPNTDVAGERELAAGTLVRVLAFDDEWAIIARDGEKLGYVPVEAILKMQ
jgi:hypothetical protein